jgi:Mrp family chromosome partitioning ATPase
MVGRGAAVQGTKTAFAALFDRPEKSAPPAIRLPGGRRSTPWTQTQPHLRPAGDLPAADLDAPLQVDSPSFEPAAPPDAMSGQQSRTTALVHPRICARSLRIPRVVRQLLAIGREHWNKLANWLDDRARRTDQKTIEVAAALHGEGCTTIAIALAVAIAERARRRVLLLDCDVTTPVLARRLSLGERAGLEEALYRGQSLDELVISSARPAIDVLPLNPIDRCCLQGHPLLAEVMATLRRSYDLVVVDGGGILEGRSTSEHIPPGIDAALLVHQRLTTSECLLNHVQTAFAERAIECLGIIENAA